MSEDIAQFLNEQSQVMSWPAKPKKQLSVLRYLADQFEWEKHYNEKQVNELLNKFHTFGDSALLRRELYMKHFLDRKPDGSEYWKTVRQIPARWMTSSLVIEDSAMEDARALEEIHDDCAYIVEWTGAHDDLSAKQVIARELAHEALPPHGKKQLHRIQSVRLKSSKEIVGYLVLYHGFPERDVLWIALLAIAKRHQGKKIGQEIVRELAEHAKVLGFRALGAGVGIKNWPALRFWIQCGFTRIAKFEGAPTHSDKTFADLWLLYELS
jgi:diamine N-acetyltransferase